MTDQAGIINLCSHPSLKLALCHNERFLASDGTEFVRIDRQTG